MYVIHGMYLDVPFLMMQSEIRKTIASFKKHPERQVIDQSTPLFYCPSQSFGRLHRLYRVDASRPCCATGEMFLTKTPARNQQEHNFQASFFRGRAVKVGECINTTKRGYTISSQPDIDTPQKINMEPENTPLEEEHHLPNNLVDGFNPVEKYLSNWMISPGRSGRGEHKTYLKPPPSHRFQVRFVHLRGCMPKKHLRLRKTFLLSQSAVK